MYGVSADYDSITVSSAWELKSVSMRYSQGDGVNTSLSRLVLYPRSVFLCVYSCLVLCMRIYRGMVMC